MSGSVSELRASVVKALRKVHDPEIPINVYDLGLIYALEVGEGGAVRIEMTLTAPNCPVADQIPADVASAVRAVPGVTAVDVTLVWEPKWGPERMTEVAEIELQSMGVDPRRAKEAFTSGARGPTRLTIGRRPSE